MDIVQKITGLDSEKRENLRQWYGGQSESVWLEVERLRQKIREKLTETVKKEGIEVKSDEFFFAVQIASINKVHFVATKATRSKSPTEEDELFGRIKLRFETLEKEMEMEKKRGKKTLRSKIETEYMNDIKVLLDNGASWRKIAKYLKRYYRMDVHYTYLQKIYSEIKTDTETEQNLLIGVDENVCNE